MGQFEGKVAVVTGGASGIGRAVSRLFARESAHVVVFDRSAEGGQAVADEIASERGQAVSFTVDVSNAQEVEAAFATATERLGAPDILVTCAGVVVGANAADTSDEAWRQNISVNLDGAFLCCRAALRRMAGQKKGAIVNIGSISAIHPGQQRAAYSAAKAGVHGLTRSIAVEYAGCGIRANAIAPGPVNTPMNSARFSDPKISASIRAMVPLGRFAEPEDIARPALFLASEAAAFITGQILIIDGGLTIS